MKRCANTMGHRRAAHFNPTWIGHSRHIKTRSTRWSSWAVTQAGTLSPAMSHVWHHHIFTFQRARWEVSSPVPALRGQCVCAKRHTQFVRACEARALLQHLVSNVHHVGPLESQRADIAWLFHRHTRQRAQCRQLRSGRFGTGPLGTLGGLGLLAVCVRGGSPVFQEGLFSFSPSGDVCQRQGRASCGLMDPIWTPQ